MALRNSNEKREHGGALEAFRAKPQAFDLLLTDHTMPHLSGLDFAREVHRIRPELPVMLVPGYDEVAAPKLLAAVGVRRRLIKPVAQPILADAIGAVLERAVP
jgi:two-component system cell cycle sensor histidine kinase/response regulator CckA